MVRISVRVGSPGVEYNSVGLRPDETAKDPKNLYRLLRLSKPLPVAAESGTDKITCPTCSVSVGDLLYTTSWLVQQTKMWLSLSSIQEIPSTGSSDAPTVVSPGGRISIVSTS